MKKRLTEVFEQPGVRLGAALRAYAGKSVFLTISSGPFQLAFDVARQRIAGARDAIWIAAATLRGLSQCPILSKADELNFRMPDSLSIDLGMTLYSSDKEGVEDRSCFSYVDSRMPKLEVLLNQEVWRRSEVLFGLTELEVKRLLTSDRKGKSASVPSIHVEGLLEKTIRAFGVSRDQVDSSARFVFKVVALECLLKTSQEEGIARSVGLAGSMMSSPELKIRSAMHDALKKAYSLRNDFVHNATPVWRSNNHEVVSGVEHKLTEALVATMTKVIPLVGRGINDAKYDRILKRFSIGFPWDEAVSQD